MGLKRNISVHGGVLLWSHRWDIQLPTELPENDPDERRTSAEESLVVET